MMVIRVVLAAMCFYSSICCSIEYGEKITSMACNARISNYLVSNLVESISTENKSIIGLELENMSDIESAMILSCSMFLEKTTAFTYLLEKGVSPNSRLDNGEGVLHLASKNDDLFFTYSLLKFGANIDLISLEKKWKPTPLYYAVIDGNIEMIDLLLKNKANINYQNSMGDTPLSSSAGALDFDTTYYLLTKGADYRIKDKQGFDLKKILEFDKVERDTIVDSKKSKVISYMKKIGVDIQ